jgi:hypothetical protein
MSQSGRCIKNGVSVNDSCTASDDNGKGWPKRSQVLQPPDPVCGVTHHRVMSEAGFMTDANDYIRGLMHASARVQY